MTRTTSKPSQQDIVGILRKKIYESISPLITSDYVLLGLPYYNNIGDTLIWEGELEFLKSIKYKCVGVCGWDDYPKSGFEKDVTILITGGGYFGDVWRHAWDNVLEGIKLNKKNRIIIMPQTIYYDNEETLHNDADFLSEFSDLIICARDNVSYTLALRYFRNRIILVPDMAFCISDSLLNKYLKPTKKNILLLKRGDKELKNDNIRIPEDNVDIHDWPTYERSSISEKIFYRIISSIKYLPIGEKRKVDLKDRLYYICYRRILTRIGIEFVSQYKKIYTTRLHVMILSVLLGKDIVIIDNSYGKLSSYYNTWLKDYPYISEYEK